MSNSKGRKPRHEHVTQTIQGSRCPKCGSANKSGYTNVRRQKLGATEIVRRNCHCLDCGQHRIDREVVPIVANTMAEVGAAAVS